MKKTLFLALLLAGFLVAFSVIKADYQPSSGDIIKVDDKNKPALYLIDSQGQRQLFSNAVTFWTWYSGDWSNIKDSNNNKIVIKYISQADFEKLSSTKNVVAKANSKLLKFDNSDNVYAVTGNGIINTIVSGNDDSVARKLYGNNYKNLIITTQSSFEGDYTKNQPLTINSVVAPLSGGNAQPNSATTSTSKSNLTISLSPNNVRSEYVYYNKEQNFNLINFIFKFPGSIIVDEMTFIVSGEAQDPLTELIVNNGATKVIGKTVVVTGINSVVGGEDEIIVAAHVKDVVATDVGKSFSLGLTGVKYHVGNQSFITTFDIINSNTFYLAQGQVGAGLWPTNGGRAYEEDLNPGGIADGMNLTKIGKVTIHNFGYSSIKFKQLPLIFSQKGNVNITSATVIVKDSTNGDTININQSWFNDNVNISFKDGYEMSLPSYKMLDIYLFTEATGASSTGSISMQMGNPYDLIWNDSFNNVLRGGLSPTVNLLPYNYNAGPKAIKITN